ncbi:2-aminoethanethiol dioxygenase [Aplysia californica]|uniref:2-aminoethanethiol dioxygenase n=1 Tax=Aplysia californica TaxID=6500 RepID=A0ABM0KAL7_APLCA|nr:2-aminoethanethiol dioxygenase [Aplysia californica]
MAAPIQKLALLCKRLFAGQSREKLTSEYLSPLICEVNKIKATDLRFDVSEIEEREANLKEYQRAPVTYMPLLDESSHTMSVFILKQGSSLPLHDHPQMYGMLKVICGKIKVTSYSVIESEPMPENVENILTYSRSRRTRSNDMVKTVIKNEDVIVSSEDGCCVLSPSEGNIHEIHPLTNIAAFLDVLAPPYADDDSCHYYHEVASDKADQTKRWLVEVAQPRSYWCDTIRYKGPQIDISQD